MGDIILNGIKYAGGGGGASSLSQLTDVNVTSPSDGQFLTYDGVAQEWKNTTIIDEGHVYSTSEKVVGKWIDGKPLYEMTLVFPLTNADTGTYVSFPHNIINVENMCDCISYLHNTTSGAIYNRLALLSASSNNTAVNGQYSADLISADRTNVSYMIGSALYGAGYDEIIAKVQYTKTTDT